MNWITLTGIENQTINNAMKKNYIELLELYSGIESDKVTEILSRAFESSYDDSGNDNQ